MSSFLNPLHARSIFVSIGSMEAILRLEKCFRHALELNDSVVVKNLEYRAEKWDSIAHLRLISEIESEFNVMCEPDDILGMSSFGKAVEMLKRFNVDIG